MSGPLQLDPNLPDYSLGNALLKVGRAADAIPIYERALRLNPNRADVCSDLAGALADVGRVPEAIQHYERALRLKPDFPMRTITSARFCTLQVGCRTPLKTTGRPCRSNPIFPEAAYNLGWRYSIPGGSARRWPRSAPWCSANPGLVAAWCSLGHALERSGRTGEAAASFEEALRRAPDSAEASENLARLRAAPR